MKNKFYTSSLVFLFFSLFLFQPSFGQEQLPWDPDPECNSIVTTGIVGVTCGTIVTLPVGSRYTFGLIDLNGALPAAGRIDVTSQQDCYHHPAWDIDSIGNVFGITMDYSGNIYLAASSNYSSDFFLVTSVIKYGAIGGGESSTDAAGTVYRIDAQTGAPTVFAVLPQQAFNFMNMTCEGITVVPRFTGPGLGNIVYHPDNEQFYVTNFEDGRIYRLDASGTILDSYDPFDLDDGLPGTPVLNELAYGLDLTDDGTKLFFGNVNDDFDFDTPGAQIFSIDLQADGSFTGAVDNTTLPAGATWDNYVGSEMLHITIPDLQGFSSVSMIADLEFTPDGNLLVGNRLGCIESIHTSYNHGGRTFLVGESGGVYNVLLGNIFTSMGIIDDENAYGGVSVFDNPNGGMEYVISSADMLSENGPHGISTQPAGLFGAPFAPVSPAGVISYIENSFLDAKGIGGDVYVFKTCGEQEVCPTAITAIDQEVCSGQLFDLEYSLTGGDPDEVLVMWMDPLGMPVDPQDVLLMHEECGPGQFEFIVTALCQSDSMVMLTDTATVIVYPSDLSPFVTVVEEPCFVDVIIDPACADFLTVLGDIPVINPGDAGTVTVQVVHNELTCDTLNIDLSYNCACSIDNLSATPQDCVDGFFMVSLDFDFTNTTGQFEVTDVGGNSLGQFNYTDLPVAVGPFPGDGTTVYTLTVADTGLVDCTASVEVGPVNCQISCNAGIVSDICAGETLFLFEDGGDAVSWQWSSDGAAVLSDVSAQDPSATGVANGEVFSVVITTASGLTDTCSVAAIVNELPTCNASSGSPICSGETMQLNEDGGAAVSWFWSTDGAAVIDDPTAQNPTATNVTDGETFTVEITDANGCMSICSTTAIVNELPTCNASSTSPICTGEPLQLNEEGGAAVSWFWSTDGAAAIDDPTAQNPTATGVTDGEAFTVEITDINGCVSSCSITVEVNDLPICQALVDAAICTGETLQLSEEGGAAVSWQWSSDGSALISDVNAQSPTATNVTDGELFTVEITDTNGCTSTCSVMATVNEQPICNADNTGPICAGEPLGLLEVAGDAVSWSWSTDGGAMIDDPTAQNPVASGVADGETFTVIITNAAGCADTCSTMATVFALPDCNAGTEGAICAGENLALFEDGGQAVSWSWTTDGGAVIDDPTAQNPTATNVTDGETFTVEITDANGCISSCSVVAEVSDSPEVTATNNGPVCEGDLLILKSVVSSGTSPYTYMWSHSNGFTSMNANVYLSDVEMLDAGTYTLVVTDANGCVAESSTVVEVNENYTNPGTITGNEYFCGPGFNPGPITQVTPPSGASGPVEFFWMKLEAGSTDWEIIPGADGPNYDPGPIYVTTQYSRCVRVDGCISALESNVVNKIVGTEAIVDPTGPTAVCVGENELYSVTAQPGAIYSWNFGPGANPQFANTSSVSVTWNTFGLKQVKVSVTTATCTANNVLPVFVTNSTLYCNLNTGTAPDPVIQVFPNPFNDRLQVRLPIPAAEEGVIQISDMQGRVLQNVAVSPNELQLVADLSDLPPGMYFLTVRIGEAVTGYQKVIKQ